MPRDRFVLWVVAVLRTLRLRKSYDSWFGTVPVRLYANRTLTSQDRDIYSVLSMCLLGKDGWIEITEEEIGEFLKKSARSVRRSIHTLKYAKEIEVRRVKLGGNAYRLITPIFAAKTPAEPVVASMPKRELVSCPTCAKRVGGLLRVGWCRSCGFDKKIEKAVDGALAKKKTA